MYYRGKNMEEVEKKTPFTVICNNCGSNDVTVIAFEYHDLDIKCNRCGSYLSCGRYNEAEYDSRF